MNSNINAVLLKFLRDQPGSALSLEAFLDCLIAPDMNRPIHADINTDSMLFKLVSCTAPSDLPTTGSITRGLGREKIKEYLMLQLKGLEKLGLVNLKDPSWIGSPGGRDIQISLRKDFADLQRAIGFSLTELAQRTNNSIYVNPVFGKPDVLSCDVFVIMPFLKEMKNIYLLIAECCNKLNLSVQRADDLFGASHVIDDIWDLVTSAKVIVCDCTHKNPNVFYELGIAHTVGKKVILITQNEADVPFDLRHWRYIVYGRDKKVLAHRLTESFKTLLNLNS